MIQMIILDLDGPIIDCRLRHYTCYSQILAEHGFTPINLEDYWQMKRSRVGIKELLSASGAESITEAFKKSWLELIEQPHMLELDLLQPGTTAKLQSWREKRVRMVLVTMRRLIEPLNHELARLGLDIFLDQVIACPPALTGQAKAEQLKNTVTEISPEHCLWIGDTEVDIEAARLLGCRVWALTCGIRTENYLASLSPDFLSPDLTYVDLSACNLP